MTSSPSSGNAGLATSVARGWSPAKDRLSYTANSITRLVELADPTFAAKMSSSVTWRAATKGVRKGVVLGLKPPLELDILQKLYYKASV